MKKTGFTLIEMLVVIAIIGILAVIIVPVAGSAKQTALKRRAMAEMSSIKVAVLQFQADHKYMPWGELNKTNQVGVDVWTANSDQQAQVMQWLTGDNPMRKAYLQIPEKSRPSSSSYQFNDPWNDYYRIGMDRNLDGAVQVANAPPWDGQVVMEKVLVYSPGPPGKNTPLKTFDVP